MQAAALEPGAQVTQAFGSQALGRLRPTPALEEPPAEGVGQVGQGVPSDPERQLGRFDGFLGAVRNGVSGGVDDRGERSQPVLVDVLERK